MLHTWDASPKESAPWVAAWNLPHAPLGPWARGQARQGIQAVVAGYMNLTQTGLTQGGQPQRHGLRSSLLCHLVGPA